MVKSPFIYGTADDAVYAGGIVALDENGHLSFGSFKMHKDYVKKFSVYLKYVTDEITQEEFEKLLDN